MQNLFITGLSGRTGKYFLEELNKNEHFFNITASYNKSRTNNPNIKEIKVDLDNYENVNSVLKDMEIVFHIAGIQKSVNIIKAAMNNNVKWVILVHTTGIYSKYKSASTEYLRIEKEIKKLTEKSDIKITILRPTMIFGSLDDQNMSVFIKMVDKLKFFPIVNGGKYALQPVSQKDLGEAYYQILNTPEKTQNNNYDLSGEKPIYLIDILKTIAKFLNKKTVFISVPYSLAYFCANIIYYLNLADIREKVQRLVEPRAYSHDKAYRDFNYKPEKFENSLKAEIDLYLKNK